MNKASHSLIFIAPININLPVDDYSLEDTSASVYGWTMFVKWENGSYTVRSPILESLPQNAIDILILVLNTLKDCAQEMLPQIVEVAKQSGIHVGEAFFEWNAIASYVRA